jgi:hypothetical protein
MCVFPVMTMASLMTDISYSVENVSGNQWIYSYEVSNKSLTEGIHELTIWFDYSKYANLSIASQGISPTEWSESIWNPAPILRDDGGYDILSLVEPIQIGKSVKGFRVAFDWVGTGLPGSQFYEVVNPSTFDVIDSGNTVLIPEPCTALLLLTGGILSFHARRK